MPRPCGRSPRAPSSRIRGSSTRCWVASPLRWSRSTGICSRSAARSGAGANWSWERKQWAQARLTRRFVVRPGGAALQAVARARADGAAYIAGYNIWMHHVLAPDGRRLFPRGVRLLSHWNLRDQIKADYAEPDKAMALARQRPARPSISDDREPDTRYAVLLANFRAARQLDSVYPMAPTEIDRHFQLDDEIPEQRVRALLTQILESPLVPKMAALIQKRLGRPLEPFDIWYSAFMEKQPEDELSRLTRARYPNADAYKKDIPRWLQGLGFSAEKARWLDAHIVVDR